MERERELKVKLSYLMYCTAGLCVIILLPCLFEGPSFVHLPSLIYIVHRPVRVIESSFNLYPVPP